MIIKTCFNIWEVIVDRDNLVDRSFKVQRAGTLVAGQIFNSRYWFNLYAQTLKYLLLAGVFISVKHWTYATCNDVLEPHDTHERSPVRCTFLATRVWASISVDPGNLFFINVSIIRKGGRVCVLQPAVGLCNSASANTNTLELTWRQQEHGFATTREAQGRDATESHSRQVFQIETRQIIKKKR